MINLLPPYHREELRGEERFRLVLIVGILCMVFFICLSLLLLSIRVYVSGEIEAQQILAESQKQEGGELRVQQIRELNSDIGGVSAFYATQQTLSGIIARISNALPENVYITSLSYAPIAPSKAKIALTGFAPQTEDLLQIRTSLQADSLFQNFRFPPSNWVRATNINFSFDFEL